MVVAVTLMTIMIVYILASGFTTFPPNKAMVVFGRKFADGGGVMVLRNGGRYKLPIVESVSFLDLGVTNIPIVVKDVVTKDGIIIPVKAQAVVRISSDEDLLKTAAVMLLNKTPDEIEYVARKTMEGHVRGIFAPLTQEDVRGEWLELGSRILDVAVQDLRNMGLDVVLFTIIDVRGPWDIMPIEEDVIPKTQSQEPGPPPRSPDHSCPECNTRLVYYNNYRRFWCRTCKKWR